METKTSECNDGPQEVFWWSVYSPPNISGPAWVAASEKGGITIYRADRSDIRATLEPKKEGIVSLAWSPIAHRGNVVLASGSKDGEVCLWSFGLNESRAPVVCRVVYKGSYAISSIAFSNDGNTMAVGTHSGSIMVWNVSKLGSPALVCTLTFATSGSEKTGGSRVSSLAFSPKRTDVLVSGDASGNLVRWSCVDDSCLRVVSKQVYECGDEVVCTAWSPSGSMLAVGLGPIEQKVLIFSIPAAAEAPTPKGAGDRLLITIPKSSKPSGCASTGHTSAVTDVSFRDNETLVSAGMDEQVIVSHLVLSSDDTNGLDINRVEAMFSRYGTGRFARLKESRLLATGSSLPCIRVYVGWVM